MNTANNLKLDEEYKYGFTTDIENDQLKPGLDETVIRAISQKKRRARVAAGMAFASLSQMERT